MLAEEVLAYLNSSTKPKTRKPRGYRFEHATIGRGKVIYPIKPKPQTTVVHVAVTTAGSVPMVAVRKKVMLQVCNLIGERVRGGPLVTGVTVKPRKMSGRSHLD